MLEDKVKLVRLMEGPFVVLAKIRPLKTLNNTVKMLSITQHRINWQYLSQTRRYGKPRR